MFDVRGGYGGLLPLTFKTSCSTWLVGLSSHIIVSSSSPVLCTFLTIIMSPLSAILNPHRRANLYTSALLVYSSSVKYRVHFIGPLLFLMASYSILWADFDAQSIAMSLSPCDAETLLHPVRSVNLSASYLDSNLFQSSTSP